MLLRRLFLLAGILRALARHGHGHGHGHDHDHNHAQTTFTSDPSVVSNQRFDYVRASSNSNIHASSQVNRIWLQIIAGGGLSGLVVANILSGEGYSVLVVECVVLCSLFDSECSESLAGLDLIPETRLTS